METFNASHQSTARERTGNDGNRKLKEITGVWAVAAGEKVERQIGVEGSFNWLLSLFMCPCHGP
jgi:hypothetical protein